MTSRAVVRVIPRVGTTAVLSALLLLSATVLAACGGSTSVTAAESKATGAPVPPAVLQRLAGISPTALAAAAAKGQQTAYGNYPMRIHGSAIGTKTPTIVFLGAGYCPYCASESWPLVVALSQFGSLHGLVAVRSAPNFSQPFTRGRTAGLESIPSFLFAHVRYTSRYLSLDAVEPYASQRHESAQLPPTIRRALGRYRSTRTIPFVDLDGLGVITGSQFEPELLLAGDLPTDAGLITAGKDPLADAVDANAGSIVSFLCRATHGRPGRVCSHFPSELAVPG